MLYRPLQSCTSCNNHKSKPQDFYFKNYELRVGNVCVRFLEFPLYHTTNLLRNWYTITNFNKCVTINNYWKKYDETRIVFLILMWLEIFGIVLPYAICLAILTYVNKPKLVFLALSKLYNSLTTVSASTFSVTVIVCYCVIWLVRWK